jgi:hypothetical protein
VAVEVVDARGALLERADITAVLATRGASALLETVAQVQATAAIPDAEEEAVGHRPRCDRCLGLTDVARSV